MINVLILIGGTLAISALLAFPGLNIFMLSFSTPFIGWNIYIANLEIPISDLVALAILFASFILILYNLLFQPGKKKKLKLLLFFPFLLFIGSYLLSLINHPNPIAGLYYISRWLILLYLAYILVPYYLINNEKKLKLSIWGLVLASLLMVISGYISLLAKDWHNSFFRLDAITFFNTYPFGINHNLIAEFLSVTAFFYLALKEFYQDIKLKKIFNILFFITISAAILTFSRAAWISIAIQLTIYIVWKQKHNLKKYGALWILSILSIIIIALPIFWKMKLLQDNNVSSTENRWLLTEIALEAWQDKPILGNGAGEFVNLVDDNIRFKAKYGDPHDSHGFLQKIIAEAGIFGLISWLFIWLVIFKQGYIAIKKYLAKSPYLLALWVGALGGVIFQIFNTSYFKGKVWLPIVIALIATELAKKKYDQEKS